MPLKQDIYFCQGLFEKVACAFFNEKIEIDFVFRSCHCTQQQATYRSTKVLVLFNNSYSKYKHFAYIKQC